MLPDTTDATDDLPLIAERLRLGLPLRGFDGREIPLRTPAGVRSKLGNQTDEIDKTDQIDLSPPLG